LKFFIILTFSRPVVVVSYLEIQQIKNSLNYWSFTKPFLPDIQPMAQDNRRLPSLQDRDERFAKVGLDYRDDAGEQDQVARPHHWVFVRAM